VSVNTLWISVVDAGMRAWYCSLESWGGAGNGLGVLELGKAKSGSNHLLSGNTEHRSEYEWAQI